jgi:hypothetical protein
VLSGTAMSENIRFVVPGTSSFTCTCGNKPYDDIFECVIPEYEEPLIGVAMSENIRFVVTGVVNPSLMPVEEEEEEARLAASALESA